MSKKVSVLIPIENEEQTLDRCFESLKNQTYQDFEIVCIDNGSTDNSPKLIEKWINFFGPDRFTLIKNKNNPGITKSLNQGLKIIESEYTARIDGDDWWKPEKLEKQIKFLENNKNYGVVGTNYVNFKNNLEIKIKTPETHEEIEDKIIKKNPFAHSCVVFRTKIIKTAGFYDPSIYMGQDYELWLRCLRLTKFHNIQEFLCHRSIKGGISFERQREQMKQCLKTQKKYIKKYNLPLKNYFYLLEPAIVVIIPEFIKKLKRKLFG